MEQKTDNIWHTIASASRFLNPVEQRYSTNELELLAVVWSLEHFKHYLQGAEFILQTDHQDLLTALKENRGNKTYQSRLTRWVDRLLPFNFNIAHIPGKQMGFADYFSQNPNGIATPPSEEDTHFIINQINDFKFTLIKNTLRNNNSYANNKPNKYDVTKQSQHKQTNTHVFCHSRLRNQSLIFNTRKFQTDKSFYKQIHSNSNKLLNKPLSIYTNNITNHHITDHTVIFITQNRPLIETSTRPIVRRYREPNKKKTKKPDNGKLNYKTPTSSHKHANRRKCQPRQRTRPHAIKLATQNISTKQQP